ncbi:hypothetical protein [Mycobacterium sp. shizuoka-1]|uniref:hypothetical protein n=1 Tax=Mycobacterium sp. shizuoka-1 TaxID=2039281 RepID=UPI00115BDC46|nr:hypothetical protein [Mycobacterium sp. shizuoka-1]
MRDAVEVTAATGELAAVVDTVVVLEAPLGGVEDDPPLFAASSAETVDDDAVDDTAPDDAAPAFECLEPVLAPPEAAARAEPAVAERRDEAVAFAPESDEPAVADLPPGELEFDPVADDPVEVSAHATPYPVLNRAAPTPSATANPPTRPTNFEAPMMPTSRPTATAPLRRVDPPGGTGSRNAETVSVGFADLADSTEWCWAAKIQA